MSKKYDNSSIKSLKGADRVRKRPAVIFGSDDNEGCLHSVFEILSNSIDEAREGHGSNISLTYYLDKSIKIEDEGRGIPVGYNEAEGKFNWYLLFCELYAGGKYHTNESQNYEYSLGLNGLGLCATQYASKFMDATIFRDDKCYSLHFEKGENIGGLTENDAKNHKTGTIIHFLPDLEVFTDINIDTNSLADIMKKQAMINANIHFHLIIETEPEVFATTTYFYKDGINDYIKEKLLEETLCEVVAKNKETKVQDREDKPFYKLKSNACFTFSNKEHFLEFYHNGSFLEHGGAPLKAVRQAFVYQIDKYLKANNKYKKDESKISYIDVEESLCLILTSFSTITSYENQTKKAITNHGIQTELTTWFKELLEFYFLENPTEAEKICSQVLVNKQAREDADKTRQHLKKKLSASLDIQNRVAKFVDCRSKDKQARELYIVEGDSALGAVKQARDPSFQAVMPIRGKILNCLKSDINKIFNSEIITDLMKVLGCGVEIQSKSKSSSLNSFNIENLRWNKIIICTDADVDGFQIRTLLLTMIYRLAPSLIEKGLCYIAESPLYEINHGKKTYFAYSDAEKDKIIKKLNSNKYTIQRSKGLGENEPEMMSLTTMNPSTRRLIKVNPDDKELTSKMFDLLLGDDLAGRKSYIEVHGNEYLDDLDVS